MPTSDGKPESSLNADPYRGYMLRLWKVTPEASWQGQLESVTTGQHHYFASLDELLAFLREEEAEGSDPGAGDEDGVDSSGTGSELSWPGPPQGNSSLHQASLASVFEGARAYPQLASVPLLEARDFEASDDLVGVARRLLRAAVPAVLYASHPDVRYPRAYEELVERVNTALASGDRALMLALAEELEGGRDLTD